MGTTPQKLNAAPTRRATVEHAEAGQSRHEIPGEETRVTGGFHPPGPLAARSAHDEDASENSAREAAVSPKAAASAPAPGPVLSPHRRTASAATASSAPERKEPSTPEAYSELASVLRRQGRLQEAAAAREEQVRLAPEDVMAHFDFAGALHRSGQFERGWAEYEWRTRLERYRTDFSAPLWDGSPLDGRTLLIVGEQGLGDQIQFVRYASLAKQRCARVVVQCDRRVLRLVQTCPGVDQVCAFEAGELPPYDAYVWIGSLPGLMGTRQDTVPADIPYLRADAGRVARWHSVLARFAGDLRVGINWEGNRSNVAGRDRAVPLESFYPLARLEGVRLFSLQKGDGRDHLASLPTDVRLVDLGQHFGELASAAAAMEALDLVITNDTSIAHLAGALGRPVWMVLSSNACWRWFDDREGSPWYPTMRIFRQGWTDGGWVQVFRHVERDLRTRLAARSSLHDRVPALANCAGGD